MKLGQTLSVRPDVLPQAAIDELAILQDSVKPCGGTCGGTASEEPAGLPRWSVRCVENVDSGVP